MERRESAAPSSLVSPLLVVQGANASESPIEAEDNWRPQTAGEREDDLFYAADTRRAKEAQLALEARRVIAISNAHEKEKNKENLDERKGTASGRAKPRAFIDRQESAERVTWDDSQQSNQQMSNSPKKKRRAQPHVEEEEISDPSEDESFQKDNRPGNVRERRNMAPNPPRRTTSTARDSMSRPNRQPRVSPLQDDEGEDSGQEDDEVQRQIRKEEVAHYRGTPAQSQPPSRSQAQIAEQQKRINQLAKTQVRSRAPAKVQTRRPWSDEETSTLIEYIMEHGTSYAFIKKLDMDDQNVLEGRDQIALKDKARNIKTDYLK